MRQTKHSGWKHSQLSNDSALKSGWEHHIIEQNATEPLGEVKYLDQIFLNLLGNIVIYEKETNLKYISYQG